MVAIWYLFYSANSNFRFCFKLFLSSTLKIIEENRKKFEVMKKFWRVKYVKNFSRQIEKGWIMIWLNALAHHLHTTALSFTVFWAQAEISGSASKDCFFESHQAMICLVPHSFYKISSPCLVYTKFFGEFVPYDKWLTLLDIPKIKEKTPCVKILLYIQYLYPRWCQL